MFLEGESLRTEYVLSDTGLIWRGTANRLRPSIWKYAQFEKDVLECSLYLISRVGKVGIRNLGDPVKTSRSLSAAVNIFLNVFSIEIFFLDDCQKLITFNICLRLIQRMITEQFMATGPLILALQLLLPSG